ncbi:MAG TPA: class I SAM-dependent methyltransferase [Pyrinomonadaceae bacterium]|nr:class I SAM-dependent methyltransferase [Pyrinomonadaceae bacterium]
MNSNGDAGKQQYLSDEVFDARYFKALDRFDIRLAPTMWVYDNVRASSQVLHVGCGAGMLALLKRKGVTITGVDASKEFALTARRNGYDATFQAGPNSLPFPDQTFDYVVSFGLLGAVTEAEEQLLLAEMRRVLRSGGVSLHSIECTDTVTDKDQTARFLKVFQHVAIEPRYGFCLSAEDFLEPDAHEPKLEADFLDYLRGLSFKERRAFDLAMGYVFSRASDFGVSLPSSIPHVLLKASDAPLGPFYNEHRDRRALFSFPGTGKTENGLCLDRSGEAVFDDGWFQPTLLPPVARWMGKQARVRFRADDVAAIALDLTTQLPDLAEQPLGLEISLNGAKLCAFTLYKYGWLQLWMSVPEAFRSKSNGEFEIELRANRTAQRPADDRELSIAVCNIEIRGQNGLR